MYNRKYCRCCWENPTISTRRRSQQLNLYFWPDFLKIWTWSLGVLDDIFFQQHGTPMRAFISHDDIWFHSRWLCVTFLLNKNPSVNSFMIIGDVFTRVWKHPSLLQIYIAKSIPLTSLGPTLSRWYVFNSLVTWLSFPSWLRVIIFHVAKQVFLFIANVNHRLSVRLCIKISDSLIRVFLR